MTFVQTGFVSADLHVVSHGNGSVKIQNMESDLCEVKTEKGHCILQSVKVTNLKPLCCYAGFAFDYTALFHA